MAYSSKKQERHYQPERIRVVEYARGMVSRSHHIILRQDMATGKPTYDLWYRQEADLYKRMQGTDAQRKDIPYPEYRWKFWDINGEHDKEPKYPWMESEWRPIVQANESTITCKSAGGRGYNEDRWQGNFGPRYLALAWAKHEAERLELPFDLKTDLIDHDQLVLGSVKPCLLCQENPKQTYKPHVCERCRQHVSQGIAFEAEKKPLKDISYDWPFPSSPIPLNFRHTFGYDYDRTLRLAILRLAVGEIPTDWSGHYYTERTVNVSDWQREALETVRRVLADYARALYDQGVTAGSNLLDQLADGTLHPNKFAETREAGER